ncbi:MAG: ABC transporter ATP-binding protein [Bacteroidetes bacterium]|nr:ABC transporter ATP-binding protein [Bacteroidota bacterium]
MDEKKFLHIYQIEEKVNNYLLNVENVNKTLRSNGKLFHLQDISFELMCYEITSLVGLNGAGKTTLIRLLLSLLDVDSGTILYGSGLIQAKSKKIGYLPETFMSSKSDLKVRSFLKFFAELNAVPLDKIKCSIEDVLEKVGLIEQENQIISKLSKGMKTRLGIAQAILGEPKIIILDEPTDGLDPQGRKDIIKLLKHLKNKGKAILISSHILSEIESVCDKILILDEGKLLLNQNLSDLLISEQEERDFRTDSERTSIHQKKMFKSVEELFFATLKKDA